MVNKISKLLAVVAIAIAVETACSNKSDDDNLQPLSSVRSASPQADIFKYLDAAHMIEVQKFADFPEGVKTLAEQRGLDAPGEGPNGHLRQFLIGGATEKSVIIACEEYGVVPKYVADAYVKVNSAWAVARSWEIGHASTLNEVLDMIRLQSN